MIERAQATLEALWERVSGESYQRSRAVPRRIASAIQRSINSPTKSYRYVLPTHLLAKLVDPEIDCRAVQESSPFQRSFDARSFCRAVVVPFDRARHNVLGGSGDPYVSNPLRVHSISAEFLGAQRDKQTYQQLIDVLAHAQNSPGQTRALVEIALEAVSDRLRRVHIVYPAPNRAGLEASCEAVLTFLRQRTGGRRLQAIATALFRVIGMMFRIFDEVRSGHVNAADVRTGHAADLECIGPDGGVVLAVEVKDRQLTVREVQDKVPLARERGIEELLYVIRGGIRNSDEAAYAELKTRQFRSGHNIYDCEFVELLRVSMILFGEEGRRRLLKEVGDCLDEVAELTDREAWRDQLLGL